MPRFAWLIYRQWLFAATLGGLGQLRLLVVFRCWGRSAGRARHLRGIPSDQYVPGCVVLHSPLGPHHLSCPKSSAFISVLPLVSFCICAFTYWWSRHVFGMFAVPAARFHVPTAGGLVPAFCCFSAASIRCRAARGRRPTCCAF